MAFTAVQFNANALYQGVNKVAHGFTDVGVVVRFDGTDFVEANNTTEPNAEVVGIISNIPNVDQFYVTQVGFVSGLTVGPSEGGGFVPGTLYYLSNVNGELTSIKPTTVGFVELPCYIAYTANTGFFFASVGTLIESGSLFNWNVIVDTDTPMAVNNGYLVTATVPVTLDLPPASAVGDIIKIATTATSTDSILIAQAAGQYVLIAEESSTIGVAGGTELETTNGIRRGSCELLCIEANLGWRLFNGTGTWDLI